MEAREADRVIKFNALSDRLESKYLLQDVIVSQSELFGRDNFSGVEDSCSDRFLGNYMK